MKGPKEKEASKSAKVGGAICLLQRAKCVLYDTAGQKELSPSSDWIKAAMAESYR